MNELALFAGAGGGILGGKLLGWRTVCAVELNAYCRRVLMQRQDDRLLEPFPIWDDVTTFDGRPWAGLVDVVSGGFPCQDISVAGKGAGIEGAKSGLWSEMARIIREVRPQFAFVENSPALTSRGLGRVLGDLAEMGFDARWGCVAAEDAIFAECDPAASHDRERIWIVANSQLRRMEVGRGVANPGQELLSERCPEDLSSGGAIEDQQGVSPSSDCQYGGMWGPGRHPWACSRLPLPKRPALSIEAIGEARRWWSEGTTEPILSGVANGMANRVERIRAIGNGQVPAVVQFAWNLLTG